MKSEKPSLKEHSEAEVRKREEEILRLQEKKREGQEKSDELRELIEEQVRENR